MNKYLILHFENAGLFRKNKNSKDKIFDIDGARDRKNEEEWVEPIIVNQVSNMLHVLFGERPKPSNRFTPYNSIPYYVNKAMESYIKITSYISDEGLMSFETTLLKKAVGNSYVQASFMYWERVYCLLGDELTKEFIRNMSDLLGTNIGELTFNQARDLILEKNKLIPLVTDYMETFNKSPYTSFYRCIMCYGQPSEGDINKRPKTLLTVLNGIDKITRINGEIMVPVCDEDIERLKECNGFATLLDGGMVFIYSVEPADLIVTDGYTQVKNISTTKQ